MHNFQQYFTGYSTECNQSWVIKPKSQVGYNPENSIWMQIHLD